MRLGLRRRFAAYEWHRRPQGSDVAKQYFSSEFTSTRSVVEDAGLRLGSAELFFKVGELCGQRLEISAGGAEASRRGAQILAEGDDALSGRHDASSFAAKLSRSARRYSRRLMPPGSSTGCR